MTIFSTSTSAFYERARLDMAALRKRAEGFQEKIGSGERLGRSSDDPVAASRLRNLARAGSLATVDTANANRASTDLTLADTALASIADNLTRARELAVQAASDTLSDDQRTAIGAELDHIHANIFALANARDSSGHALFGGETSGQAYTLDGAGNAVYAGTASSGELPLGEGQSVTRGLTGPEVLQFDTGSGPTDIMAVVRTLGEALKGAAADPAGAARDALGQLTAGMDSLTTGQTVVGARLAWIDLVAERRTELSELRASEEADIGGTDIASAIAQLQEAMVVLEASQASFTRLSSLSLMNQLR